MTEITDAPRSCPRCLKPAHVTAPGGVLYVCPTCAITFVPAGAEEVGLVQQTAKNESHLVVDRVPLSPAFTGRYVVSKLVGSGGMGTVYLARDRISGRDVCVKFLHRMDDRELLVRFLREGKMLAQIHDPHVVELLEAGETRGYPYLVMEHVGGGTLREKLNVPRRRAPAAVADLDATLDLGMPASFPVEEATGWMRQILEGLAACHQRGIVHRDLKPENVLVTADGVAKLSDLGIGKDLSDTGTMLTRTGEIMGTPTYVSPEQIRGEKTTTASDVYSFGVMAYELVSGSPPFVSLSIHDVIRWHKEGIAAPLDEKVPGAAGALASLVGRCLAKDPAERPRDAMACLAELDRAARPVAAAGKMRRRAVACLALALLALAGSWKWKESAREASHRAWEDLERRASDAWTAGRRQEAEALYEQAAAAAASFDDAREARTLHSYAVMLQQMSRTREAETLLLEARRNLQKLPEDQTTLAVEVSLAHVYGGLQRPADEEDHHRRAFEIAERISGKLSSDAVVSLIDLARCRLHAGRIDQAQAMLGDALRRVGALEKTDPVSAAHALYGIGDLYMQLGDPEAAEGVCRRELALLERAEGPESDAVGETLRKLASFYHTEGRLAEAGPLMLRALEISRKANGAGSIEVVYCLENLAGLALGQGAGGAAVQHATEAISILEEIGPGSPRLPKLWIQLGQGHEQLHEDRKALACFRRAVEQLGPPGEAPDAGRLEALTHLGGHELRHGDRKKGEECLAQASAGLMKVTLDPFRLSRLAQRVAMLHEAAGRPGDAVPVWQRAVQALDSLPAAPAGERMVNLLGLGRAQLLAGRDAEAEAPLKQAFALWDESGEGKHPFEIQYMTMLGTLYLARNRPQQAIECFTREGKAFAQIFERNQISVVTSEVNLATALTMAGRTDEGIARFEALLERAQELMILPQTLRVFLVRGLYQALRQAGRRDEADRMRAELKWLVMPSGHQPARHSPWKARLDRARSATLRAAAAVKR